MDELSAFKNAAPELPVLEASLMKRADLVFTGGQSLYEAKKHLHHNIHALPSSVDTAHFAHGALDQRRSCRISARSRGRGSASLGCSTSVSTFRCCGASPRLARSGSW